MPENGKRIIVAASTPPPITIERVDVVEHPEVAAEEDQGQDDRDADKKADPGGEIHEKPPGIPRRRPAARVRALSPDPKAGALKEGLTLCSAAATAAMPRCNKARPKALSFERKRGFFVELPMPTRAARALPSRPMKGCCPLPSRRGSPSCRAWPSGAAMSLIRLYIRVLGQLGSDLRIGAVLALANVALAITAFAEPILFGRIIDAPDAGPGARRAPVTFGSLTPLIVAWVGVRAVHDRRRRHSSRCTPTGSRTGAGSPSWRTISSMCSSCRSPSTPRPIRAACSRSCSKARTAWPGSGSASSATTSRRSIALVVLLPLTVFLNWRLGLLLVLLVVVFAILTAIVLRKTETLQGTVERYPFEPRRARLRRARQRAGHPVLHPHRGRGARR